MNKLKNYSVALKILMWVVISINSVYILTGIVMTADSVRYVYAARTFPNPKHLIGDGYFSIQPLLYPIFLKGLLFFGEQNQGITFAVFHLLLYLIAIYFALKTIDLFKAEYDVLSDFGKLLLLCSYGLLHVFDFAWSEALFVSILSAAIYFLARYSVSRQNYHLLTYLLLCGLLPVTRYIGVFILFYNFVYIAYLFRHKRATANIVLFFVISLLPFALNLVFNHLNSGEFTGGERGLGKESFIRNMFLSFVNVLKGSPIPVKQAGLFLRKHMIVGGAAFALLFAILFVLIRHAKLRFKWKSHFFRFGAALLLISFIYLLTLAYTASRTAFDVIDMRLVSPVLIPVFIVLALLFFQVDFAYKNTTAVILSVLVFGLYAKRMHTAFTSRAERTYVLNSGLLYRKYYSHDEVFQQLKQLYKTGSSRFFTNDPYRLMMYTGIPSEFLPERNFYNSRTPKFSDSAAQKEVWSDSAVIVLYAPNRLNVNRFYPLDLYIGNKSALINNDTVAVFK